MGLVVGVSVTLLLSTLFDKSGTANSYPARIQTSSKGLLADLNCYSVSDGSYLVSGRVLAPPNSGVLKIGALINFGNTGPFKGPNVKESNFYSYFDTNDPTYEHGGGGALTFNVIVNDNLYGEAQPGLPTPEYCEAFVVHKLQ